MGKKIGYQAFDNRLHQMWTKRGGVGIMDLGKEYYMVRFTNKEDQYVALIKGPWMIYD